MINNNGHTRQAFIDSLKKYLKNRLSDPQILLIEKFAERYYSSASLEDLYAHHPKDLFGALLSHWQFIFRRKPGESKVRIFNPSLEKEGYQTKHTIIEVSHDDIPFLVDSIRMEMNRKNVEIHLAVHCGGLKVIRDASDEIIDILPVGLTDPACTSEAPIYFEIDRQDDIEFINELCHSIEKVLADVRAAVRDWRHMVERLQQTLAELELTPPPLDPDEIAESQDFLRWMINNHFTFLGCRDYKLIGSGANRALRIVPGSGLGVMQIDSQATISRNYADLPPQARKLALSKNILIIAKTNTKATIHRDAYTDYVGVKRFNEKGEIIGECRFVGLYTSTAYHSSPRYIPFLRHKVEKIMQELRFPPDSHNGKEVVHILETLPRDDLFQATHEELMNLTLGILQLQERKQIRLFLRKDSFGRYYSCLVYVPREIFTSDLCDAMQDLLMQTFQGRESSFTTYFSDSVLARIHYLIRVSPKINIDYQVSDIEKKLVLLTRSWLDIFKALLVEEFGESQGLQYFKKYRKAYSASYMESYTGTIAIEDLKIIESLSSDNPLGMVFFQSKNKELRLKLFNFDHIIALSDVLPTLENMGLRIMSEQPSELNFKDSNLVYISDFSMYPVSGAMEVEVDAIKTIFQDAFANIWFHHAEDDGFNHLVLAARLAWKEITILRAYCKYLRQIGFMFSQNYIEQTLVNHSEITKNLINLFFLRFSPTYRADTSELVATIEKSFDQVTGLDEDRILRRLLEVILATIRTNYFQKDPKGKLKDYISFKLDPNVISDLPLPKPLYEIFVYSPRVEGVHLRGGKVARGGLRWSDRREDFRTEILGLMKAQNVKNSVIVPVGAKGGFFPKQLPIEADRDAILKEVIYCYSTFVRGLLDITDNIKEQTVVPPVDVVRYDDDDPYLVVAADKGTATFSDIANAIARERGFWLDDAFASGGSVGYDHKKIGITARGAWKSVERHFRELGIHPDQNNFRVVGIGDMSGDVFGNAMLLSKHIQLIAAFDHRHIFIDPNPDPMVSFTERNRLFLLSRSSWLDYNLQFISPGGGVFNRAAKYIKLSPEVKKALDISQDQLVPNDLIRAILKAPVDLLFNGGIGTFVKASTETHTDVGDRTNDGIRIDGWEVQASAVSEGGNLGFTQLGRVEYALKDGMIYTDFIDNSAGVDCSDHEVNIKILLNKLVSDQRMTLPERNQLLESMKEEVAELVLQNNYEQTQVLSLEAAVATRTTDLFRRYINELEKRGRLNRQLEYLPEEKAILERKANEQGLTRPELAIMVAYCKIFLKQDILASTIPEDPYFAYYLKLAFPKRLSEYFFDEMKAHSLRREIIATQLAKTLTDHMGVNFVERLQRETGATVEFIIRSYAIAGELFGLNRLWQEIEKLDYKVSLPIQQKMMLSLYFLIRRSTRWFLRNRKPNLTTKEILADFSAPIAELIHHIPLLQLSMDRENLENDSNLLIREGVPEYLAKEIIQCDTLFTSLDIVEASIKNNLKIVDVAKTYYILDSCLELNWLRKQMSAYSIEDQWDELARSGFRDDLDRAQRKLSVSVLGLRSKKLIGKSIEERIETWLNVHKHLIERWQNLIAEIKSSTNVDFVTFSIVLRELFDFAHVS